ncbi:MAG: hypothetical protein OXG68_14050 [Chloroflexi bacterium]|nr:hypothetical protein [Chloroflexota bacterium]
MFRQTERWLHQHIFKVGWLLTNNFQTTTILYYILFLPGILLHELSLWLAAGILNVRAERAIAFPAEQEIGELQLNFIRISPQSGAIRYSLAKLAPILAGLVCLWMIAARIFSWQDAAAIAASGSIDALALALSRVTKTADFWLWFYLAFTVANTMFPALPWKLSAVQKTALAATTGALTMVAWVIGGGLEASITQGIESLAGSLALVMLQMMLINAAAALVLGALETMIERVTGKSATFTAGKMIAMSRREAQERKAMQGRERRASRQEQQGKASNVVIRSAYDLKLPIPGPPGREPVSRSAVAVVNLTETQSDRMPRDDSSSKPTSLPSRATAQLERPSPARRASAAIDSASPAPVNRSSQPNEARQQANSIGETQEAADGENAPFSRPFANAGSSEDDDAAIVDDGGESASDNYFPRPFAMKSRAESESETSDASPDVPPAKMINDEEESAAATQRRGFVVKTKPAPKPSRRSARKPPRPSDSEFTYEPLDEGDVYPDDEDDEVAAAPSS